MNKRAYLHATKQNMNESKKNRKLQQNCPNQA